MWVEQPAAHALTAGQGSSSPQPGSQPHPRLLPGGAPALRGKGGASMCPKGGAAGDGVALSRGDSRGRGISPDGICSLGRRPHCGRTWQDWALSRDGLYGD